MSFGNESMHYTSFNIQKYTNNNDLNSVQQLVKEIKDTIDSIQVCDYVNTNIQMYPFSPNAATRYSISIKISEVINPEFKKYLLQLINDSTDSIEYGCYNNGFIDVSYDKDHILKLLNSFI